MSIKTQSLGLSANTTQAINVSSSANATPIVITLTAGHGLKEGNRIAIAGVTGNTNANGEWTLSSVGATTATLVGSSGNGAHGGTARVAVIFDRTPLMDDHAARLTTFGNHVGVVDFEAYGSYDDFAAGSNVQGIAPPVLTASGVTNSAGSSSTPAKSTLTTATTNAGFSAEIKLPRYLRVVPTTATSGTFAANVSA